jgi:hypothetical protein
MSSLPVVSILLSEGESRLNIKKIYRLALLFVTAVVVAQQDKNPLMSYSADAGGAVMHGGCKWFQLFWPVTPQKNL